MLKQGKGGKEIPACNPFKTQSLGSIHDIGNNLSSQSGLPQPDYTDNYANILSKFENS